MEQFNKMEKLLAYHGKQEIKDKYVARMKAHIEADELVQGIGFEDGKGCAVGCTLNNYNHIKYENELGFPMWIARIEDSLFEGMSLEKSKTFPLIFLETIQPGMVLESIKKSFLIYILEQALTTFDNEKFTDVRDSILRVITFYKTTFDAESETQAAAREVATEAARVAEAARAAVWAAAAARAATWAAVRATDAATAEVCATAREVEIAAGAAADSVARVVGAAAWAAWEAVRAAVWAAPGERITAPGAAAMAAGAAVGTMAEAAAAAARAGVAKAAYDKYADKLIELIKQCTIER